jgi:tetraacyldisaccharide 4'-kinase
MRAPAFWWRERPSLAAFLLSPLGLAYGAVTARRMAGGGVGVGAPVICVGNPVAGGAGKTPTALVLARFLTDLGARPAFVSRGYGGATHGPLLVDPQRHDAATVGDEPLLLARQAATYVARNRVAGAQMAVAHGADVIVLDDGFQNPALTKVLSVLVVDGAAGTGNGLCLPAGPLRAPLSDHLRQTDTLVIIGDGAAGHAVASAARSQSVPTFTARLVADASVAALLKGRRVVGFAGIGRPGKFAATLREVGADLVALHALADHAAPTAREAQAIVAQARSQDALVVATEKDVVKLSGRPNLGELAAMTTALPVRLVFDNPQGLQAVLKSALVSAASGQGR